METERVTAPTPDEPKHVPETDQGALMAALADGSLFGEPIARRVDTHAATIFLTADRAWKIKRAVRYPYLDFSTAALRRKALDAELRYNRRTAPDLYLAVHAITRTGPRFELDGGGPVVDWILEMRRFPDGALLADQARIGALGEDLCATLADRIANFHRGADVARDSPGGFRRLSDIVAGNAQSLAPHEQLFGAARIDRLLTAQRALLMRHREVLDRRARAGKVRHIHGDLHLANIALIDGMPTMFDCLEFDTDLATADVLYDLAFLLMDLWHCGLRDDANYLYNRYFDLDPEEDASALLPLMMSVRATIRAHVAASTLARTGENNAGNEAHAFLALAETLVADTPPRLVTIGGLSGTGKSAVARRIAGDFLPPPGARILRSDVWRKHLAGAALDRRLDPSYYSRSFSATVYARLDLEAERLIRAGHSVIIDAVFAGEAEREAVARLVSTTGVDWQGLWLDAPVQVRVARVARRRNDVSDANADVAREQSAIGIGSLRGWIRVPADRDLPAVVTAARDQLRLPWPGNDAMPEISPGAKRSPM